MTDDHDHPDTDLTDPHGEAEAQPVAWLIEGHGPTEHEAFARMYGAKARKKVTPLYAHPPAPQPTIGGAELDALVARLRTITSSGCNPYSACHEAASAITALRAQPDWKAMAERLGDALRKQRELTPKSMRALMFQGRDGLFLADDLHKADDAARVALSDLAKMNGE